MPQETLRIIFILELIFVTGFWILTTSAKGNLRSFITAIKDTRSGLPVLLFEILCFVQVLFFANPQLSIGTLDWLIEAIGLGMSLYGMALASWAKWVMGANWGRPAQHDRTTQKDLVTAAPFCYSRNPIYVGLFLLFLGLEIGLRSYGALLAIPLAFGIRSAVLTEEKLLQKYFGKVYSEYKKTVPRFL